MTAEQVTEAQEAEEAQAPKSAEEKPEEVREEAPEEVEELEALRQRLAEAESKVEEYLDQWRRAAADLANYRKRVEKEQAEFSKYANAVLITKLLPILDDFQRAFQTVPDSLRTLTWIDGIVLIERKMQAILEQEGLTPIEAVGKPFDPLIHEAVIFEETADHEDGQVIAELQKGYKLHDRVLRPTLVKVAKKPT
ncbi:MAG: nucleotide exchange factor GrpE [Anaerolineae bacterium]